MNLGIIIQARRGSTRLPDKMLLPFYEGKSILELIIERLLEANLNKQIILATTDSTFDDVIVSVVEKYGIKVYRGDENNVLRRFIKAAELHNFNRIIRICADNPFLDMSALRYQINHFISSRVDYWCYSKKDFMPTIRTHYGFWTEGVTIDALRKIDSLTKEKVYQEHVTNYIYSNPDEFQIHYELIPECLEKESDIRLTVDSANDFKTTSDVYDEVIKSNTLINAESIAKLIKKNQIWLQKMKNEIEKNKK